MRSCAKVNIFLKIVGKRDDYHEICSRFVRVEEIYDDISFLPKNKTSESVEIIGEFSCPVEKNSIYLAIKELIDFTQSKELVEFFKREKIVVEKRIKEGSGLGGGSSNAASTLLMCNEILNLNLSRDTLAKIGSKIGADVPFFVYGYKSANVYGIGERVCEFSDDIPKLKVETPDIECNTKEVYKIYRENYFSPFQECESISLKSSRELLESYDAKFLNDLALPAMHIYPGLSSFLKEGRYFSGSGSSVFEVV